jgi:hypothetical protein
VRPRPSRGTEGGPAPAARGPRPRGAEFRVQRWLSNASVVQSDPATREQFTFGIGPRFHIKVGEKCWFRPGVSYTRYLNKPLSSKDYNIVQIDLPFSF